MFVFVGEGVACGGYKVLVHKFGELCECVELFVVIHEAIAGIEELLDVGKF